MTEIREQVDDAVTIEGGADVDQAKQVLRNPKFLALFGSRSSPRSAATWCCSA